MNSNKPYSHILIVEDETFIGLYNKTVLTDAGLADKIVVHENGLSALNYLVEHLSSIKELNQNILILLDLFMPVMDGFEFLECINKLDINKNSIRVCVSSVSSNLADIERVIALGAHSYLSKPFTSDRLLELIKTQAN